MRTHLLTLAGCVAAAAAMAGCGDSGGTTTCDDTCNAPPTARCEGDTYIAWAPVGECVDGECRYESVSESCAGGCGEAGCVAVPCDDADCTTPPAAACDGDTALTYATAGSCGEGDVCTYAETRTDCAATEQICEDGACVDPVVDPCEGVVCDAPPTAACDGDTAVTYATAGTCDDGVCAYDEIRADCTATEQICEDGACVDPVVDPCEGVVCDAPPTAACEADTAVAYAATGTCDDGVCAYDETRTDCAATEQICEDGACVDPVDPCADVVCDDLPDDACDGSGNRLVYSTGECVAADGTCDYVPAVLPCDGDSACVDGACVELVDPCEDVVCSTPPEPGCASDTERSVYSASGVCQVVGESTTCVYDVAIATCDASVPACFEGVCRAIPGPDQLQITEIQYDPAGIDDGAEWIELRNPTGAPLFLGGIAAETGDTSVELGDVTLAGGALLVLEASPAATPEAGIEWAGLALDNTAGYVELVRGDEVIDRVGWDEEAGWPAATGRSLSLDPGAAGNDDPAAWCFGTAPYGFAGSLGSPGAANAACDFDCFDVDCPIPPSFCEGDVRVVYSNVGACVPDDGSCDYSEVEVRQDCADSGLICDEGFCRVRPPSIAAGSVIVNEFLANSAAGPAGDWIELRNTTDDEIVLDDLVVSNAAAASFTIEGVTLPADGFVVLAAAADTLAGGADYVWGTSGFAIGDDADTIVLTFAGDDVDRVDFDDVTWPIEADTAAAFSGGAGDNNNDAAFWCASRAELGDGGFGTPGAANDDCFAEELPDPPALAFGALVIAEVMIDPTGISDEEGEWFEIYNASGASIDMRAIEIRGGSGASFVLGRDGFFVDGRAPILAPNGLFVVGRSVGALGEDDEATSRVTYVQSELLLDNVGDTIAIWAGETMVDSVTYTPEGSAGFPWPYGPGVAMAADTFSLAAGANDEPWAWCEAPEMAFYATFSIGDTDFPQRGTPGNINPFCGF